MEDELTETYALLVSKQMMEGLRKVHYEKRDKYSSIAAFVRAAIYEKLEAER